MGKSVKGKNIVTGETIGLTSGLDLAPYSNLVLELMP